MIVDCIADLHGNYPKLPGGDLLIIAGDLTDRDTVVEHSRALEWIHSQKYKKKIVVAGNHDNFLQKNPRFYSSSKIDYLCDSGTEFYGFKIWGSPWTPWFKTINPKCMAFVKREYALKRRWDLIPDDTDILITHGPPHGALDLSYRKGNLGSKSLMNRVIQVKPKYHIFGHIHECNGLYQENGTLFINCSHVNEWGVPINDEIGIEVLDKNRYDVFRIPP